MSIIICKYCGMRVDTDYNVDHEAVCAFNPKNDDEDEEE